MRSYLKPIFICSLVAITCFLIYLNQYYSWEQGIVLSMKNEGPPTQWDDPGPYHVAYPRNYKFIMDGTKACKVTIPFVVLMVPVAPNNVEARDIIRRTWGKEALVEGQLVQTLFVLGFHGGADADSEQEMLRQENLRHRDMIQSNFQDSYHNLTIKTMVMLEWLAAHCVKASYVMKIDADVFLNVKNLVKLLLDFNTPKENFMTGLVWWHSPVMRNPFNKFYMPNYVIAESEYPPYPLGMAYIMSLDLPLKILNVSRLIKPIYIEDAYLGAACSSNRRGRALGRALAPGTSHSQPVLSARCCASMSTTVVRPCATELRRTGSPAPWRTFSSGSLRFSAQL